MPPAGRIPREIVAFFASAGGHSLIVKGPAGTGKTTFALQLTEEIGDVAASHYLSSRVSDESLYNQFTWLKDRVKPAGLQTGLKGPRQTKVARDALNQLEGKLEEGKEGDEGEPEPIGSGEVKGNILEVVLGVDLPELEDAYDFVDDRLPKRSLVLIDSIDALAEHYGIPAARLITVLQRDIVEGSKQNVLYVLESSGETRLDYLGDGVVSLVSSEYEGRRLRVLTIEKLRGQQIQQHRYLYTFEAATLGSADVSRTVLHMEGTNVDSDLKWSNVEFQLPKSERPFLAFMAFDTLESVYSDKVLEAMSGVFGSIRRAKDVFVGFTTPQSASAAKLENLARVVLHLETINGSVVLYGSKPYTGLFSLSWDLSSGVPKADLRPIV